MSEPLNLKYEYECALSGVTVPGEMPHAGDGLDDLPQGWFEVRLSRRTVNPKWLLIQNVKEAMLNALLSQYPKEVKQAQEVAIRLQLEAQFFALESATTPYLTDVETVYMSPPESSEDVAEAVNEVREMLGLTAASTEYADDVEDEPPAAAVEEPAAAAVGNKRPKKKLPEAKT
jgi:hypothetical protein